MYNLIEYSDNYSDSSGSLWNFKRDEIINNEDLTNTEANNKKVIIYYILEKSKETILVFFKGAKKVL